MRTKELKANTAYATESGGLVMTGDTVERGWYAFRERTGTGKGALQIAKDLPGSTPANDPWSSSSATQRRSSSKFTEIREGIRVMRHLPGRDGEPEGEGQADVLDPKHIKGTWADYKALHMDRILTRFLKEEAEAAARAESLRLGDKLKQAGILVDSDNKLGVTIQYMVKDREGGHETPYPGSRAIESFRLEPYLELRGDTVENALDGIIFDGH